MKKLIAVGICLLITNAAMADLLVNEDRGLLPEGYSAVWTGTTVGSGNEASSYSSSTWDESGEEYVFQFMAPEGADVAVTGSFTGGDLDLAFLFGLTVVADEATEDIGVVDSGATLQNLAGNTPYYLAVDGYGGASGTFELQVDVTIPAPPITLAEASIGTLNRGDCITGDTTGSSDDFKYEGYGDHVYTLNHPGGALDLSLAFDDTILDLDLWLFDAAQTQLESSLEYESPETISGDYPAGTYYALIDGWECEGAYELCYTPEPATLALIGFGALALIRRRR